MKGGKVVHSTVNCKSFLLKSTTILPSCLLFEEGFLPRYRTYISIDPISDPKPINTVLKARNVCVFQVPGAEVRPLTGVRLEAT